MDDFKEVKSKTSLINIKEANKVVLALITLAGATVLLGVSNLALVVNNSKLATRDNIFVEQLDGTTRKATEKEPYFRSDEVIRETVSNWLYLTWEWDSSIPGSEETDTGIKIEKGGDKFVVPTKVYSASYLIAEGFREEFLENMSELIPEEFYRGTLSSQLTIYFIGKPVRKGDTYEVEVIATRKDINNNGNGETARAKFNKTLILQPIEPYKNVMGGEEPSPFRKYLTDLLKNGLIITSVHNT
jgi:hypothetical protein